MIIDASAMLDVLLRTDQGIAIEIAVTSAATVQAPAIIDLEVAQVLRRLRLGGRLSAAAADRALEAHHLLVTTLHPIRPLLGRAWSLLENVTVSDALYIAAAQATGLPLLTTDERLARAVAALTSVELLPTMVD